MKHRIIKAGILTGVFVIAIIVFSYLTNRGNADMTADMSSPTLPRVSFILDNYTVNELAGYRNDMEITAMRDTIVPIHIGNELQMNVNSYDSEIKSIAYEVFSIDGVTSILSGHIKKVSDTLTLDLGNELAQGVEGILKVTLNTKNDQEIYYYTRVLKSPDINTKECIDFVNDFHNKTLDKTQVSQLAGALESNSEGDNSTYHEVTIHSDIEHVGWGNLHPEVVGNVQWNIKEANASYSSIQLEYQVRCNGELNEKELYNVKEFFRVRYQKGSAYLLDYNRTMEQIFDGTQQVLTEKGIVLGITSLNVPYTTNEDGTIVSFVQERELWNYNQNEDNLSLVFSFASAENTDIRNRYNQHDINIVAMDRNGSTTFVVYGYMNRGEHEGEVGAAIYYYDIEKNSVEEKAFIPSNKSFAIAEDELGKLVYYNNKQQVLYVMTGGTLYKVDLVKHTQEELVTGLKEGQYVASEDGHLLAYQNEGDSQNSTKITVLNLKTGKDYVIAANDNECVRPLGFVFNDFVYGVARPEEAGRTLAGEITLPMYKVEISDTKGKVVKTYAMDQVYILDVAIQENMITLNRVTKNGDVYTGINQDYITNNEEKEKSNIELETIVTDQKETQMRLTFAEGISDKKPKLLKPKQVLFENPTTVAFDIGDETQKYYVYGIGKMQGVYDKAGYAIQKADTCSGIVVTSQQKYVWEHGNRDITYEIENPEIFTAVFTPALAAGKTPMEILSEYSGGNALDLTGCTTEQILYVINKGTPVMAMIDSANAIILTGYGKVNVQYINPATGAIELQPIDSIDQIVSGSGNTFIGYLQ